MQTRWVKLLLASGLLLGIVFVSFHIFLMHNVLQAQEESPDLEQDAASPAKIEEGNITVDFKEAEINDVLKIISYKSGVNIVAGQDVSGTVTIRLVDVPWERALDVILKNSGFVYERDKDIIRVTTVENLSKEELSTQIFILNYAKAEQVADAIKEILTDRGRVKFDERTNQLVVTDIPTNLYKISKIIGSLDKKTVQVMIETKVIETTLDEDERLGIDWTLQASASGSARPLNVPFAFDKTYGKTGKEYFPKVDTTTSDFTESIENGFPYAVKSDFTFGTLSFTQLQGVLELLQSRSDTRALSNPKIVTLNNNEAVIHVGEDFNIPLYERNTSTGQMEITDYKQEKIGVKLTVTPHVNAQGEIMVDLQPEISAFLRFEDFGNVQAPVFSIRSVETQIMVKDGETIVIGGLIRDTTVDYEKKVPILGDIPLLKYVFSKTEQTVDTTDLMLFVTVRLLDPESLNLSQQPQLDE